MRMEPPDSLLARVKAAMTTEEKPDFSDMLCVSSDDAGDASFADIFDVEGSDVSDADALGSAFATPGQCEGTRPAASHSRVPCRHGALLSVLGSAPEGRTAVVGTPARAERATQSAKLCDRRGGDSPPRPLPSPGPRICEAATATSLETNVSSPPLLPATRTHRTCPTHAHAPRPCLSDLPPSLTHPLACHPVYSSLLRLPARQQSIPHSPLPYPLPHRSSGHTAAAADRPPRTSRPPKGSLQCAGAVELDHPILSLPQPIPTPTHPYPNPSLSLPHPIPSHLIP